MVLVRAGEDREVGREMISNVEVASEGGGEDGAVELTWSSFVGRETRRSGGRRGRGGVEHCEREMKFVDVCVKVRVAMVVVGGEQKVGRPRTSQGRLAAAEAERAAGQATPLSALGQGKRPRMRLHRPPNGRAPVSAVGHLGSRTRKQSTG